MNHVALLGDLIFDNRVYVAPHPDVSHQLRGQLGEGWSVSLLAVDGHVTSDVRERQVGHVPTDVDYIIVSAGENDALGHASILSQGAASVADAVGRLAAAQARFARSTKRW